MTDLRQERRALGLTRTRLAIEADCSVAMLQMLEDGYRRRHSDVLPRVVAVLAGHQKDHERPAKLLVGKEGTTDARPER
jgi:predicted transcriptional regulator